jgi:PmbA protein
VRNADGAVLAEARRLLAALRVPPGWQAEVFLTRSRSRDVAWAESRPKDVVVGEEEGLSVRALRGGRQGFAYAGEVSAAAARSLWRQAADSAAESPADRHRVLYVPDGPRGPSEDGDSDPALFGDGVDGLQQRLAAQEKRLLRSDRRLRKALSLAFHEQSGASAVASTAGVAAARRFGSASYSVELMAESRGETQVAWDYSETRRWADLRPEDVLDRAREAALASFGARPVPSGRWTVLFRPRVGVELLELLAEALGADSAQRSRSFFAGRRGRRVASPAVTLVDDARLPGGLASAERDDEGCPTRRVALVEGGVLKDFLYDAYTARREGRPSGGNAGRPGVSGPPSPDSSNFFLAPGAVPAADLLAGTPRGYCVEEVLGMHTADPVSGDFSVGTSGRLVERGRVVRAVKGVTLAGNLLDLLGRVDAVADDLTWYGSFGSPSFRAAGLSVGGS